MDKQLAQAVDRFKRALEGVGLHAERIVLFGSRASGTGDEHSDIDLAVVSRDFRGMNILERLEAVGLALAKARVVDPIEAMPYTPEEFDSEERGTFLAEEVKARGVPAL